MAESMIQKVSILIPVFNEINTLELLLQRVEEANFCGLQKEIIIVDDCSTDGTKEVYGKLPYKIFYHDQNRGKGAAVRTALKSATGDVVVIQDADLEYDPCDYDDILKMIMYNGAKACYGSRLSKEDTLETFQPIFLFANRMITMVTNFLYNSRLDDVETCYKAFKKDVISDIEITSNGFSFDPEITAKVLKKGVKIHQVPISSYDSRNRAQGKKITWVDGVEAVWTLIRYRFFD